MDAKKKIRIPSKRTCHLLLIGYNEPVINSKTGPEPDRWLRIDRREIFERVRWRVPWRPSISCPIHRRALSWIRCVSGCLDGEGRVHCLELENSGRLQLGCICSTRDFLFSRSDDSISRKSCLVIIRQSSIHGNVEMSFWWPDVLPDINQLGLGKGHWNQATSSAEVEFCLCTVYIFIYIYFI